MAKMQRGWEGDAFSVLICRCIAKMQWSWERGGILCNKMQMTYQKVEKIIEGKKNQEKAMMILLQKIASKCCPK